MRTFSAVAASLLILAAVAFAGFGSLVLADADSDGSWTCRGSDSTSYCTGSGGGDTQYQAVGIAFVVGGCAMFLGACVLLAGITAAGRTGTASRPVPVPSGGPPTWGA